MSEINIDRIRNDFPILSVKANGNKLVYLDNAATTHKPIQVINAIQSYYGEMNGNPHRGAHYLGILATEAYEEAREKVSKFINASSPNEIVFTRNTTESLNMIAYSYGMNNINPGDEILLSICEHHSNIVPWQQLARLKGAKLRYVYLNPHGEIDIEDFKSKLNDKTKILGIVHMSNVLGTINPVKEMTRMAHDAGAVVIVDGAQSTPHIKVDVRDIDADFFVFSGHKMLGPMGIGVLYGKHSILEKMPPFLFGGDMIEYVTEQDTTFAEVPFKFEAGTQNVEGAVGLSAAIDYINGIGIENIFEHEKKITEYALNRLEELKHVTVYGPKDLSVKGGVISFGIDDVHPHDTATILDSYGVAIRAGHHCAQPLMKYLKLPATSRASFYFYNSTEEVDVFVDAIKNVRKWLGYGS